MEKSPTLSEQVQAVKDEVADLINQDPKLSNQFYLARWLQASQFDVQRAARAIRMNRKWRKEYQVDEMVSEEQDANFASKFPYLYGMKGKDGRPVVYLHAGIIDFPGLVKEFGKEETLRQIAYHMVRVEKQVFDWDNEWEGPMEDFPAERTKGAFFIVDTEGLTMKKAASATGLEWTRMCVNYFPTQTREAYIINAPSFIHIPCKLFMPLIAAVGSSLYIFPSNGTRDEELEEQVFSVISPQQLDELRAKAKKVEKSIKGA